MHVLEKKEFLSHKEKSKDYCYTVASRKKSKEIFFPKINVIVVCECDISLTL